MMKKFKNTPVKIEAVKPIAAKHEIIKAEPVKAPPATPQAVKSVTAKREVIPAPAVEKPKIGHVSFELVKPGAKQVSVAGTFNDWKP